MSTCYMVRRSWRIVSHQLNTNPYPAAFLNYRATMRLAEITIEGSTYAECGSHPLAVLCMLSAVHVETARLRLCAQLCSSYTPQALWRCKEVAGTKGQTQAASCYCTQKACGALATSIALCCSTW